MPHASAKSTTRNPQLCLSNSLFSNYFLLYYLIGNIINEPGQIMSGHVEPEKENEKNQYRWAVYPTPLTRSGHSSAGAGPAD